MNEPNEEPVRVEWLRAIARNLGPRHDWGDDQPMIVSVHAVDPLSPCFHCGVAASLHSSTRVDGPERTAHDFSLTVPELHRQMAAAGVDFVEPAPRPVYRTDALDARRAN